MASQWPPQQQPVYPQGGPPPDKPSSSGTRILVALLIVLGVLTVLGIGGCVACGILVSDAVDEGVKTVDKRLREAQNRNSITDAQAASVEKGTRRERILARFGPPANGTVTPPDPSSGLSDCLAYNVRDGTYGSQWEFCFRDGKLIAKSRRG